MKHARGFTLIELAIVLVIITILIGGLAVPLSTQIQARRIAETKKIMEEAREAILGYAMTHSVDHDDDAGTPMRPYLPCPDRGGDGVEDRQDGLCATEIGWFPWVTLATAAQDAWGNRLRYATHDNLTRAAPGEPTSGFHIGSAPAPGNPWNQVCSEENCELPIGVNIAADVPVVLISHGPNGWGALNVSGAMLANPGADSKNELENLDGAVDKFFNSRTPSDEFDDLVTWLSFDVLINRVCPAAGGCQ